MDKHSRAKYTAKSSKVGKVFLFKGATLAKIRQDWQICTPLAVNPHASSDESEKNRLPALSSLKAFWVKEMVPNSKRSDERLFHQDENSCRNCLSHLKPFSHSSLNRIQTCNKTCKYRDKGSKNLAASARIYLFVEALGSYSMVAIHCMSERGLHQYSSTFSQSVS